MASSKQKILKDFAAKDNAKLKDGHVLYWGKFDDPKWRQTFTCEDCGFVFEAIVMSGFLECPVCSAHAHSSSRMFLHGCDLGVGSLTPWQKKKLALQRDNRKWKEDILSRRTMPNGDVAVVDRKSGRIKEVRPKDNHGRYYSKGKK